MAYSGYRLSVYGSSGSPGLQAMLARLAANCNLPVISTASLATVELARIKKSWTDKESKPPTTLDPSVVAQLACAAAADKKRAGQGFVLLDFPNTPGEFKQLADAGVVLAGLVHCGDGGDAIIDAEAPAAAVLAASKPKRAHFAAIDVVTQKPRAVGAELQAAFVGSVLARHGTKTRKTRVAPKTTCSAFAITLFTLDDQYESSSSDFMEAAFELFPQHDYCMITLP